MPGDSSSAFSDRSALESRPALPGSSSNRAMQIVTYPPALIEAYLADTRRLLETGQVAEGTHYRELASTYVPGKLSIPVASGGAAIFALLAYQKYVRGRTRAIVQSNTMRALYTVPTLLDMKPLVVSSSYEDFLSMNPDALQW